MYQLSFYVPESHLEEVKNAVFRAGGGRYREYDCCAWQTRGTGQFRPLDGASPFIGRKNKVETVDEFKVELIVTDEVLREVVKAVVTAHPYEEPAYTLTRLLDPETL